jgi:hypothetical protein
MIQMETNLQIIRYKIKILGEKECNIHIPRRNRF